MKRILKTKDALLLIEISKRSLAACLSLMFFLPAQFLGHQAHAETTRVAVNDDREEAPFHFYSLEDQSLPSAPVEEETSEKTSSTTEEETSKEKNPEVFRPGLYPQDELVFTAYNQEGRVSNIEPLRNIRAFDAHKSSFTHLSAFEIYSPRHEKALLRLDADITSLTVFGDRIFFYKESDPQFLHVMNLKTYETDLGRARIPVFRIPLPEDFSGNSEFSYSSSDAVYSFGELRFNEDQVVLYESLQEIIYNAAINLLDPQTYPDTTGMVKDLDVVFARFIELSQSSIEDTSNLVSGKAGEAFRAKLADDVLQLSAHMETNHKINKSLKKQKAASIEEPVIPDEFMGKDVEISRSNGETSLEKLVNTDALEKIAKNQVENRRAMGKVRLLWARLVRPRPLSSNQLLGTLEKMEEEGLLSGQAQAAMETLRGRGGRYWNATLNKVGSVRRFFGNTATGVLKLAFYAAPLLLVLNPVGLEALDQTFGFITHPTALIDRFGEPGEWGRMGVRLAAFGISVAAVSIATHFSVIFGQVFKDWRSETDRKSLGFKKFLIERQQTLNDEYLSALDTEHASTEEDLSATDILLKPSFTAEDDAAVDQAIREANRKGKVASWFGHVSDKAKQYWSALRGSKDEEDAAEPVHKISTFGQALQHAFLSMSSFTQSQGSLMKAWIKYIFPVRSFWYRPTIDLLWARNPIAIGKMIASRPGKNASGDTPAEKGRIVLPTESNGGLRGRLTNMKLWFQPHRKALLDKWEDTIIAAELEIEKIALLQASHALVSLIDDPDEIKRLYLDSGITSVSDSDIMNLPKAHREYFTAYYSVVSEELLRRHLQKVADGLPSVPDDATAETLKDLKEQTLEATEHLELSAIGARNIFEHARKEVDFAAEAKKRMTHGQWGEKLRWKAAQKLDRRNNPQVARIQDGEKGLRSARARIRAVRQALAGILVDKPLEIIQMLLCLTVVDSGINQLFRDEFWGPDSIAYLGKFPFLFGFGFSLVMSVLAEGATKLNIDSGNADSLEEKNIPKGEDAKKSLLSWFWKQGTKNPKNNFIRNHINLAKVVWANIPAYLTILVPIQLMTLGRVEFDILFVGYLLYFFTPKDSIGVHADQTFEFSADYFFKDFEKKYHRHPKVLEYISSKQTRFRLIFNVFAKTYENFTGFFSTNLMSIQQGLLGTKSFIRGLFGGVLPTEYILNAFQAVDNATNTIPGAEAIADRMNACAEFLLENNYSDGTKLIPDTDIPLGP